MEESSEGYSEEENGESDLIRMDQEATAGESGSTNKWLEVAAIVQLCDNYIYNTFGIEISRSGHDQISESRLKTFW